jgi:hypothetical protein
VFFMSTCHKIVIILRIIGLSIHMNLMFCGVHYTKMENTSQIV